MCLAFFNSSETFVREVLSTEVFKEPSKLIWTLFVIFNKFSTRFLFRISSIFVKVYEMIMIDTVVQGH